jgi:hypothetical protein
MSYLVMLNIYSARNQDGIVTPKYIIAYIPQIV